MGLLEALRDPQFRSDLGTNARQLGQSASNTIAESVTMPVDALAWLLRRSRVNVPQNPIGGSDWAKQQGLMADVPQGAPKMAGEALGLLAPMAGTKEASAKIAQGLRQMGANAAAPNTLGKQAGVVGGLNRPGRYTGQPIVNAASPFDSLPYQAMREELTNGAEKMTLAERTSKSINDRFAREAFDQEMRTAYEEMFGSIPNGATIEQIAAKVRPYVFKATQEASQSGNPFVKAFSNSGKYVGKQ